MLGQEIVTPGKEAIWRHRETENQYRMYKNHQTKFPFDNIEAEGGKKIGRLDFMPCQGGWWCAANFHVKIDDAEVQSLGFVQYVFFVHHAALCLCYGTVVIHGFSVPQGQASLCFVMRSISHPKPCFAQEKHLGSLWMDACWQPVHIQLDLIWEAPSGPFTVAACPLFAFAWPRIWKCLPE
jgi:hypothetical protein